MQLTTVSTSLVHPTTPYHLEVWDEEYIFAHPTWWAGKRRADVGMDLNNQWGVNRQKALEAFYQFVAPFVVWPDVADTAAYVIEGARLAEIGRMKVKAGHLELFDV